MTVSVCFNLNATRGTQLALVCRSDLLPVITLKHYYAGPRAVSSTHKKNFGIFWRGCSVSHSAKRSLIIKKQYTWLICPFFTKPTFIPLQEEEKQPSEQYVLHCISPVPLPWPSKTGHRVCVSFSGLRCTVWYMDQLRTECLQCVLSVALVK